MIAKLRGTIIGLAMLGLAACTGADDASAASEESGRLLAGNDTARADSTTPALSPSATQPNPPPVGNAEQSGLTPITGGPRRPPRRVVVQGTDLTGIGYDVGSPDAKVVVVNFSDFGCPFCGTFARETYPALEREFVQPGKVFFKYVPFVMGMFPNAREASRAAECAADQGKFWQMHDRLYAGQQAWKRTFAPEEVFRRNAAEVRLDVSRFNACYASQRTDSRTADATRRAEQLSVRATPSFFVNGRLIEGALPLEQFRMLLREVGR